MKLDRAAREAEADQQAVDTHARPAKDLCGHEAQQEEADGEAEQHGREQRAGEAERFGGHEPQREVGGGGAARFGGAKEAERCAELVAREDAF